jgi:hypothetical protein
MQGYNQGLEAGDVKDFSGSISPKVFWANLHLGMLSST